MSRAARNPVEIPAGVEITIDRQSVSVKGPKGLLSFEFNPEVQLKQEAQMVHFEPRSKSREAVAQTGTARALVLNMIRGVTEGYERRLELQGVGFRAQAQGTNLNLTLGFSHPVVYPSPEGVQVETPTQTEIVVKGIDKQVVGQVAAEIRRFRPPDAYKGKGVRYSGERVVLKEAKKK